MKITCSFGSRFSLAYVRKSLNLCPVIPPKNAEWKTSPLVGEIASATVTFLPRWPHTCRYPLSPNLARPWLLAVHKYYIHTRLQICYDSLQHGAWTSWHSRLYFCRNIQLHQRKNNCTFGQSKTANILSISRNGQLLTPFRRAVPISWEWPCQFYTIQHTFKCSCCCAVIDCCFSWKTLPPLLIYLC